MMFLKLAFMIVLLLFSATLCMALLDKHVTKCKLWFWKNDILMAQMVFILFISVHENSVFKTVLVLLYFIFISVLLCFKVVKNQVWDYWKVWFKILQNIEWAGGWVCFTACTEEILQLLCVCYHMELICYNPGYFMLHVLRTVGATGWLVSQKVLSLLWLALLSPGHYSNPCVCALPVPFGKLGDCRGLH